MELIPDDVDLPELYSTEDVDDPEVKLKLFNPWGSWSWYIIEYDPVTTDAFGIVDGHDAFGIVDGHLVELGYFNLAELKNIKGPGGLRIERDKWFEPKPLSEVIKEIKKAR